MSCRLAEDLRDDALGQWAVADEVLHEPRRAQHGEIGEPSCAEVVDLAEGGFTAGHRRGTQLDDAAHPAGWPPAPVNALGGSGDHRDVVHLIVVGGLQHRAFGGEFEDHGVRIEGVVPPTLDDLVDTDPGAVVPDVVAATQHLVSGWGEGEFHHPVRRPLVGEGAHVVPPHGRRQNTTPEFLDRVVDSVLHALGAPRRR